VIFGVIVVLIFMLIRHGVCWYFRINEIRNSQAKILDKLEFVEHMMREAESRRNKFNSNFQLAKKEEKSSGENDVVQEEQGQFLTEDEMIKEIFKSSKNIVVYDLSANDKNIFTYFRAKQYNVLLINRDIEDFKTYATIMSVEDTIDVLLMKTKADSSKLKDILKE